MVTRYLSVKEGRWVSLFSGEFHFASCYRLSWNCHEVSRCCDNFGRHHIFGQERLTYSYIEKNYYSSSFICTREIDISWCINLPRRAQFISIYKHFNLPLKTSVCLKSSLNTLRNFFNKYGATLRYSSRGIKEPSRRRFGIFDEAKKKKGKREVRE